MGNVHGGRRVRHYHYPHHDHHHHHHHHPVKKSITWSSSRRTEGLSTSSSLRSNIVSSSRCSRPQQPYVFGTVCLNSYVDVGKALMDCNSKKKAMLVPRKIQVGAKFLNTMTNFPTTHHKRSLRRVLRRGCAELELVGNNPHAPRRVYEAEVVFVLERLQHEMIECLHIENIDIQQLPQPNLPQQVVAATVGGGHKLLENLKKLTNLRRIVIKSCRMGPNLLQDLLQALRKLPHLQEITLELLDLQPQHQQQQPQEEQQQDYQNQVALIQKVEATLSILLQTNKIINLSVPTYPKTMELWKQMMASPHLTSLSLPCCDVGNLSWIERVLLENNNSNSNLKSLELRQIQSSSSSKMDPVINGLKDNTTLEELRIILAEEEGRQEGDPDADAGAETATIAAGQVLVKRLIPIMKNHNFTLNRFELYQEIKAGEETTTGRRHICTPVIDFYTQLNKEQQLSNTNGPNQYDSSSHRGCSVCCNTTAVGRSYLLRQGEPTREEWKQVLTEAASKADVSTLYYWLRAQPTLVSTAMTSN